MRLLRLQSFCRFPSNSFILCWPCRAFGSICPITLFTVISVCADVYYFVHSLCGPHYPPLSGTSLQHLHSSIPTFLRITPQPYYSMRDWHIIQMRSKRYCSSHSRVRQVVMSCPGMVPVPQLACQSARRFFPFRSSSIDELRYFS